MGARVITRASRHTAAAGWYEPNGSPGSVSVIEKAIADARVAANEQRRLESARRAIVAEDFDRRFARWLASDRDVDGSRLPPRERTTPIITFENEPAIDEPEIDEPEIKITPAEAKTAANQKRWDTQRRVVLARDLAEKGGTTVTIGEALGTTTRAAWKFCKRHAITPAPARTGPVSDTTSEIAVEVTP